MKNIQEEIVLFKRIIKCIGAQFGKDCEVVLHDLKRPYDSTIVAIENGHVTGRGIGDSGTNLGLEVLRGTVEGEDRYNYVTQTKEGRVLRSSSIYINDDDGNVIGSICINFDITNLIMVESNLKSLINFEKNEETKEFFTNNVDELLDILIQESLQQIGKPVALMTKEDKMKGLDYLDKKGALLIKKSGDRISKFYDISKYTLYNYLEEIRTTND
ncbi:helix-turn-helix transcriptional regulator [Maledivibacter halophilus]|uniref:Predicted transcriptional regulator YheO, contains PAS and DNA-binding HTH domains n=1 Tax=Maledivibacter halophilus TaxID=36842 RepID=A0A1T5MDT9_9FIRM|nr:helix-turn-helix transcriptional regulator [Maledivibacter halophilus]SKC86315.1 Predicted transcriptional regulator YheO, contains PAS and DNA-binding HTH domains [Maledivibacter halophilus]